MGLLSSVSNFVSGVADKVSKITSPINSIIGGISGIAEPIMSFFGGNSLNQAQTDAARDQMNFQENMSSTAYQRSMADMRAAGLNPIFAYQKGGASTPSGAMPTLVDNISQAANSAMAARAARQSFFKLQADTDNVDQMTEYILQQQKTEKHNTDIARMKSEIINETKNVMKKRADFENENDWLIYLKSITGALGLNTNSALQLLK